MRKNSKEVKKTRTFLIKIIIFFHYSDAKLSEKNLAPQACFEIGMINYETNHYKEAKKWLKKVKNLYSSYITQTLVDYRAQWTLDLIKSKKKNSNNLLEEIRY